MTLTHECAIKRKEIPEMESFMQHEHANYIRITNWYQPSEEWMLNRAKQDLAGCDFKVVVKEDKQAIYRRREQVMAVEE